jgi:hypothetical protein
MGIFVLCYSLLAIRSSLTFARAISLQYEQTSAVVGWPHAAQG